MKDPADKHTPELLEQQLASVEPSPEFERRVRDFLARGQAAQRAVDELGAGQPKPRRVRTGGASKSASRSADKPERSAK